MFHLTKFGQDMMEYFDPGAKFIWSKFHCIHVYVYQYKVTNIYHSI